MHAILNIGNKYLINRQKSKNDHSTSNNQNHIITMHLASRSRDNP